MTATTSTTVTTAATFELEAFESVTIEISESSFLSKATNSGLDTEGVGEGVTRVSSFGAEVELESSISISTTLVNFGLETSKKSSPKFAMSLDADSEKRIFSLDSAWSDSS
ncbi:hypothetical protein L1887_14917 [Cichorium endivia]|nr:hypothetical protein L1887_14917 [Cichorium endivia]